LRNHCLIRIVLLQIFLILFSCRRQTDPGFTKQLVNPAHLNYLYEEITFMNQSVGIIHIYADYPDYKWTEAPGEGIACVDDAARAVVFYLQFADYTGKKEYIDKSVKLLEFIRLMQAPNGMFYNFIDRNYQINSSHQNSRAQPGWWTWRAIWALSEGSVYFKNKKPDYSKSLLNSIRRTFSAIDSILMSYPDSSIIEGLIKPEFLPERSASDQAAVLLLALSNYYKITKDSTVKNFISKLSHGIMITQTGDSLHFPYMVFRSWENTWHAWGNSQSLALLKIAQFFQNKRFKKGALGEIKYFYPYFIQQNFPREFVLMKSDSEIKLMNKKQFPQIAYGIRPYVQACLQAYAMTHNEDFAQLAGELGSWLIGKNIVGIPLYDPATGRCFDGIIDEREINRNSGAESTIEALLALLAIQKNSIANQVLSNYFQRPLTVVAKSDKEK